MSFRVYRWDDADAPVLDTSKGSLINLLEQCLVNGYGSGDQVTDPPDPAWQVEKSADGLHAVFWSTAADATGHYFYVRDDGELDGDPEQHQTQDHGREAYITGATDFIGWGNGEPQLDGRFPTLADMPHGAAWPKRESSGYTSPTAWVVVADRKTVYLFVGNYEDNGTDNDASRFADANETRACGPRMFGDLREVTGGGALSMVGAGGQYNLPANPSSNGNVLNNGDHDGQRASSSPAGSPGARIRRFREDGRYCANNNGNADADSLQDLEHALWEMPQYMVFTSPHEHLWALRGIREPSINFIDSTGRVEHFFYSVVGIAQGDPLMATVGLSGHQRWCIASASRFSNDDVVVFFDLEDDQ